ncbi:holo-ACP synthase [Gloeocapsa sp. BRSZ]
MIRLGTDIVYIPRIQAALDRFGDRFLHRVYTITEQYDCGYAINSPSRPSIHQLGGRWAAKEAVTKALATGWRGISYTEIEIRRHTSGAPTVYLHGKAAALVATGNHLSWQLSLSHDRDYAIATVILIHE